MTIAQSSTPLTLPDHTQLPESDGTFVKNFQEHPQSLLLTSSIRPVLDQLHPDGQYAIGQDCGIYWRETDPPEKGAEAPDWFYVRSVKKLANSIIPLANQPTDRKSYTPNLEGEIPAIVMELLSDQEGEEYSVKRIHPVGKWFFYEQVLRVPHYAIFEPDRGELEVYQLDESRRYELQTPDANNRYWIAPMNLFLGIWQGTRQARTGYWLRWWHENGEMLWWGSELVTQERQEKDCAQQRAEQEYQRAEKLAAQLRAAGIEPEL